MLKVFLGISLEPIPGWLHLQRSRCYRSLQSVIPVRRSKLFPVLQDIPQYQSVGLVTETQRGECGAAVLKSVARWNFVFI